MLAALSIQNVVLIEHLQVTFKPGLCALTGETGAGKSILLDSLGLALGARSESGLVRAGAEQASVIATFEIEEKHPAHQILQDADLQSEPTLILRRVITKDGRSRAFINDQPVSAGLLKQVGDTLVEIHGQFDTQGLLNPATHRSMLDEYAGIKADLPGLWMAWKSQEAALEDFKNAVKASQAEEDYLRGALEDLDQLAPKPGEEAILADLRGRLMYREQVLEGLAHADQLLNGDHDPVGSAQAAIDRIAEKAGESIKPLMETLARAQAEIQEAQSLIQNLSTEMDESEHDLQSIDDRLFGLRAQARKHQCTVDGLADMRDQLAAQLNAIEHAEDQLAWHMQNVEKARAVFVKEAAQVSAARRSAAQKLDSLVAKELPPLKLDKAQFFTDIEKLEEADWGLHGCERVRFLVATNPGSAPGPLNKIASGGEMARFMLALKVVMASVGSAQSLIFDEVDTGIGGGTADAVGERLAQLATGGTARQVLVVTHSPQVAARAKNHWIVQKEGADKSTTSVVELQPGAQRREEIARMLAGASITEEARAAADKLLEAPPLRKGKAA